MPNKSQYHSTLVEASSSPSRNSRAAHLAAARRPSGAIGHPEARKGWSDREKLQIFAGNHAIFSPDFFQLGEDWQILNAGIDERTWGIPETPKK